MRKCLLLLPLLMMNLWVHADVSPYNKKKKKKKQPASEQKKPVNPSLKRTLDEKGFTKFIDSATKK